MFGIDDILGLGGAALGWLGSNAKNIGSAAGGIGSLLGVTSGSQLSKDAMKKAYKAYTGGEQQFLNELAQSPKELEDLKESLTNQTNELLQGYAKQSAANMAQQGIRGGQASIAQKRATGEVAQSGLRDLTNLAYQNAMNRQQQRANYFSNKAQTGLAGMVGR